MTQKLSIPYYPMYVHDFDESDRVIAMNLAEVGLYTLALNESWKRGSIPDDPKALATLIRKDQKEVRKAWPSIRACYVEHTNSGRLVNIRQEAEREKAKKLISTDRVNRFRERQRNGDATVSETVNETQTKQTGNGSASESSSGSASPSYSGSVVLNAEVIDESDLLFQEFIGVFLASGVAMNQQDVDRCEFKFLPIDIEEKRIIVADVKAKATNGTWPTAEKTKRPWNYLDGQEWTRKALPRALPTGNKTAIQEANERARKRFMEGS